MADNSQQAGADTIATDDVATLNGAASSGVKVQRVKVGFGDDGVSRDVSAAFPLPVNLSATAGNLGSSTGTLTVAAVQATTSAANTTGIVVKDVSAAGNATIVLVGGTYTVLNLVFEASIDPTGSAASWFQVDATRVDGSAIETFARFTTTGVRAWNVLVPGYQLLRVRAETITQTAGPTVTIVPGPFLFDPSPSVSVIPMVPLAGPATIVGQLPAPVRVTGTAITAATDLVAAPGAGLSIYVRDIKTSNSGATLTVFTLSEGATAKFDLPTAATGGQQQVNLSLPWKLPANTALRYATSAATTSWFLTCTFYVAP